MTALTQPNTTPDTQTLPKPHWEPGVEHLLSTLNPWLTQSWNTQLIPGAGEPLYLPADAQTPHNRIFFAHGYFNSALHELAHWCLAGERRRGLEDYGYWYCPDGRNAEQQAEFERVEVKPQAIEWWLTLACGRRFRTSLDNLSGEPTDSRPFRTRVQAQAITYAEGGLPSRAESAVNLLSQAFEQPRPTEAVFSEQIPS
ncbi:elongation factor P hydroxylase [Saccharospirillum salsuginis]|uniref:Transporting ATPase n=1 Tax=Saccharospirillum salsuginis TaxID=418750 RepID=A0A918NF18_9GAMM|nr:elongation factor P hydroxylase [Saccharospirillum salsuginis]GGX62409.1 transporting ATPase [Saccharospirillum salsuginis]